jgi:alpha-1,3-rhamnosyl/mannosyltransferase
LDLRYATPHYPGIGRYVTDLAAALAALATLPDGLEVVPVPSLARPRTLSEQWALRAAGRRLGCDVWHAPFPLFPYAVGVPVVVNVFDAIAARRLAVQAAVRLAARRAAAVLVPTRAAAADVTAAFGVPADRLRVVPLGVDARFRPLPPGARGAARARLSLPDRYLLTVGSSRPHKNLPGLLRGFARLAATTPGPGLAATTDLHLVAAGRHRPADDAALRALAARLGVAGRLRLPGLVAEADLPDLYAAAEAVVVASTAEGFGLPVLEGMASGVPVACSDLPALAEVAGAAAARFPAGDDAALAAALTAALDHRAAVVARGLDQAARFPWARTAEATMAVYREAAGR